MFFFANNFSEAVFSFELCCIEILTDTSVADFSVTDSLGTVLLSERYRSRSNKVQVYDIDRLVQEHMRSRSQSKASFTFKAWLDAESVSATVTVIYCDRLTGQTVSEFARGNFFSGAQLRRVSSGFGPELIYYPVSGETIGYFNVAVTARGTATGAIYTAQSPLPAGAVREGSLATLTVGWDRICDIGALYSNSEQVEVLHYTISMGERSVTFFIDPDLRQTDGFRFRNCFNCWDTIFLPCVTTAKTTDESSIATLGTESVRYDHRIEKSYEVQSAPLTPHEATLAEQMLTSHELQKFVQGNTGLCYMPILISEFTCELSDGDDKPDTVKFTWQFTSNRANLLTPTPTHIFTSPFNINFS